MNNKVIYKIAFGLTVLCALTMIYYQSNKVLSDEQSSQNILLIAIPKSASTYIFKSMGSGLNYQLMLITKENYTTGVVYKGKLEDFFSNPAMINKNHYRAPYVERKLNLGSAMIDIKKLKKYSNKFVVHIRDPREVLLSLIHYVNLLKMQACVNPPRPDEYYTWDLSRQIDWGIDNLLPSITTWITDWVEFKDHQDSSNGLKILITTYDEMLNDELGLYKKILAFYQIPMDKFNFNPPVKDINSNFRKGDPNEWRAVFTEEQKKRIAAIVPDSLLERFNWQK